MHLLTFTLPCSCRGQQQFWIARTLWQQSSVKWHMQSSGQRADTHRADEIGQIRFKLTPNVTAGWKFFPYHISDSDCSGLEFWFKHKCELTIAACKRPAFVWRAIVSSVGTGYLLDILWISFPKKIYIYEQTKTFFMYIFPIPLPHFHSQTLIKCAVCQQNM